MPSSREIVGGVVVGLVLLGVYICFNFFARTEAEVIEFHQMLTWQHLVDIFFPTV